MATSMSVSALSAQQSAFTGRAVARTATASGTPAVARVAAITRCSDASQSLVATRRAALAATIAAAPAIASLPAFALIPDDEDEELLARAKANRAKRLEQEYEVQKAFVREQGYKSATDGAVAYVQQGVNKLAKAGSFLDSGDLSAVSGVVKEGQWVSQLKNATSEIGGNATAKAAAAKVSASIESMGAAAAKGNATGAKGDFVAAVTAIESFAGATGLQGRLKGL